MPTGWLPYARVDDVSACVAEAPRRGGTLLRSATPVPRTRWHAVIADPDGNAFALFQYDASAFPLPLPE